MDLSNLGGLSNYVIGTGICILLGVALKKIPAMIQAKVEKAIDDLFTKGDAADDEFLIAAIRWAEAKYGAGSGKVKAEACVTKILALLPLPYRTFITESSRLKAIALFQETFDRLEAIALKKTTPQ